MSLAEPAHLVQILLHLIHIAAEVRIELFEAAEHLLPREDPRVPAIGRMETLQLGQNIPVEPDLGIALGRRIEQIVIVGFVKQITMIPGRKNR